MFPKITSPCPANFGHLPTAEKNHCTLCNRSVHNLNAMSAEQRLSFLQSCNGKVCVAYTIQRQKNTLARGAGLLLGGLAALSGAAFAADTSTLPGPVQDDTQTIEDVIILGGVMADSDIQLIEDKAVEIPELKADAPELEFVAAPSSSR